MARPNRGPRDAAYRVAGALRRRRAAGGDTGSDAEAVRRSGLVDRAWLEMQTGETYADDDAAVDAFLASGAHLSPHPLFEVDWLDPRRAFATEGRDQLSWYLDDDKRRETSPHPLLDVARIARETPTAAAHPAGPVAGWLAQAGPGSLVPTPPGVPEVTLGSFRALAETAYRRHRADTRGLRVTRFATSFEPDRTALPAVAAPADAPLVTVVMPTWNRAGVLREAVASVQAQTWASWELLVVDDGSLDDTRGVLEGIAAFDERVVPVHVPHVGVSRARNEGLARARGRYVAFLDSDNTWRSDYLQVMVEHLEAHHWRMAHAVLALRRGGRDSFRALEGTRDDLLVGNHVDLNVLVAETSLVREVGGFDETLRRAVDHDLVLRLADETGLHLVRHVGSDYTEDAEDPHRISVAEPVSWLSVVLGRRLVDWDEADRVQPVAGRVSVVLPTSKGLRHSVDWIRALAPPPATDGTDGTDSTDGPDSPDLELVVVGSRLRQSHRTIVEQLAGLFPHVRVVHTEAEVNATLLAVMGACVATGEDLVLVSPESRIDRADVASLVGPLHGGGDVDIVQPVVVDPAGLVASAGAVFGTSTRPEALLAGHPVSDARAAGVVEIPAPLGPVVATTRRAFLERRGLDPLLEAFAETDYALRSPGRTVLQPAAVVRSPTPQLVGPRSYRTAVALLEQRWPAPPPGSVDAWAALGLEVVGRRTLALPGREAQEGQDGGPRPAEPVFWQPSTLVRAAGGEARLAVHEHPPALRWTIDLASPAGPRGELWGDTHFARSLAQALERRGQRVAVDARQARHRPTRDLDDVLLVLRGLDLGQPRPGLVTVEWVISHPDLVTREEAAGFDLVYAAGHRWATEHAERWGFPVRPLLQCTDPERFHPGLMEVAGTGPQQLFVGNSRKVYRTSVRAALAAGVDLTVYGTGWDPFLPAARVAGASVPNAELGRLYASAGVVLNDHWEDMRRDGFLSNRLFDAAACGARVVSDRVEGMAEIFGDQVRCFTDETDIEPLLRRPEESFPGTDERHRLAAEVVAHHSFDARAGVLLDDAVRVLRGRRA